MKVMNDFCCKWKPSYAYCKIDTFIGRKDEWDTKEALGKSMKNAKQYRKKYFLG